MNENSVKTEKIAELPAANRLAWRQHAEQLIIPQDHPYKVLLPLAPQFAKKYLTNKIELLLKQIKDPWGPEYLVLRNMPIDQHLPPTPPDGKRPKQKETWVSEMTLLGVAASADLLPLSYREEKGEALTHEVAPCRGQEECLSNGGRVPLGFHTDDAILKRKYRPEYLILLGLKNSSQTPTYIAPLDRALRELSSRHQSILGQPSFRVEMPESFNWFGGKVLQSECQPLVTTSPNGEKEIAGNTYAVKTKNKEAQIALDALIDVLPHVAEEIVLNPGDLLLFNNHRCLHARAAVSGERWLQRIFCRHSLEDLRRATGTNDDCHIFDIKHLVLE